MDVEQSYFAVSWFFDPWVRLMEYHTRKMRLLRGLGFPARYSVSEKPT